MQNKKFSGKMAFFYAILPLNCALAKVEAEEGHERYH